jgi:opacity protein-like surface antigen
VVFFGKEMVMEKKLLLAVVVVVCLLSSVALALDPMGPPIAGLKQGQWSAGADYSYSEMDLKWSNGKGRITGIGSGDLPSVKIKNYEMNKLNANLGYGITDNWDVFLRLGGADGRGKGTLLGDTGKFDGDTEFAFGFGTRVTLWEQSPELKWGGLAQASWAKSEDKVTAGNFSGDIEIDITEIQLAVGPSWTATKGVSIYGGPFCHLIYGDAEGKGRYMGTYPMKASYDIREVSWFGGYIGAQVDVTENIPLYLEWQHTGNADAFCVGVVCKFK